MNVEFDVAIVGYGPVGALTALQLAEAGLRVVILERDTRPVVLPRAVALDGESVRAFQRLGFGETVAAILQPPREKDEACFTNSKRERLFGLEIPPVGDSGWRDVAFFDQPELEALLRELVGRQERIEVLLGHEVTAIQQDGDGVRVRSVVRPDGAEVELHASWLVGCDGACSFVRRTCGIGWESLGYDQDWLVVDVIAGPQAELPLVTMQVCDPQRIATYLCGKDPYRRWEFQLAEGETREEMLAPEKIRELLDRWLPPEHYEIRRAAVYQFHAATADRWRDGRIFLAGDAAHQTPPFLGQGLNAGFRDAVNLGWKLPLVHRGLCEAGLLETYAGERDAHARELVEWAVAIGKLIETLAAREAGLPDPHPAIDLSAGYGQGRAAPPLRDGVLMTDQAERGLPVGVQLLQPTVRVAGGEPVRLDELLGPGFAVVGRTQADVALGAHARAVLEMLDGRAVGLEGLTAVEGACDPVFDTHAAVVLRPDRYVFGVVDDEYNLDALLIRLAQQLALRRKEGRAVTIEAPEGSTNHDGEVERLWTGADVTHRFVKGGDITFHVVTAGDPSNPVVVFAHGFPESWYAWHHQMTALAAEFHCVAFDLKGYGQSAHPTRHDSNYDYAHCAREWVDLFDALGLDRFVLIAHDRGVVIADHFCAIEGIAGRLQGYVRVQQSGNRPHSEPRPPHEFLRSPEAVPLLESGPLVDMAYGLIERIDGGESLVHTPIADEDIERMRTEVRHPGAAEGMSASFVSAGFDGELEDRMDGLFAAMTMPVLFLQGRYDPGQQPHEYETITCEVPDGRLEFVDAGHFAHLEKPAAVTAAIRGFLGAIEVDTQPPTPARRNTRTPGPSPKDGVAPTHAR
ncbi:bifunctional 3-(3-hydroxy-phenyl)propionate/3-hydroxycinnamic acid hydroxylase [Mycobacterium spongiae]|uniref:Alpha/beta fold hydrolase n=1 Tax=Mycobacterium spongiae TaxID=886343 RepID=A0A975JV55_9MYCO|nr:bifunctional 3-(3-hydroxy-phenyl)propionate/3-hydroxycinnamic acid hydroxylase [Mycobacterium spongiae]QUR66277.1 alpha/beta fold hydrolase [Mycobacterium spongiae]